MAAALTSGSSLSQWWGGIRRALGFSDPITFDAGPDFRPSLAEGPSYEVAASMSAFAAFAWVRACVDAIASDLAGLPLVVVRGRGPTAERLDDHPALDLLAQPTSFQSGEEWRRQVVTFLLLTGNAYALQIADGMSLPLMHPERVKVSPGPWGGPAGYIYGTGQDREYRPEDVLHWRLSSWEDGPQGLLGTGLIQALHNDLDADLAASKLTAQQAKQGRPAAVISPKNGADLSEPETRTAVANSYAELIRSGKSAIVLSGEVDLTFPTYTPRDMEFQAQRGMTRETILAAFGVPPTRVGLPTANYATAQQQDRTYWTGLVGLARLLDGQLSRVVRREDRRLSMSHDFSGVEALQESRTERLNRVLTWTMLGATEAEAAAYEGFHDAPVRPVAPAEPAADPAKNLDGLFPVLVRGEDNDAHLQAAVTIPTEEPERAAAWSGWVERAHKPAEVRMQRATRAGLRAQAERVAGRLGEALAEVRDFHDTIQRDLVTDLLAAIWPEAVESKALADALRAALAATLDTGYREGAQGSGTGLRWSPTRRDQVVLDQLAELVSRVNATTKDALRIILQEGIAQGQTVAEMQTRIQRAVAFGPSRALMVARTETTKAVAAGSAAAYQDARASGVTLKVQWLSARDGSVRDEHRALDGQVVEVGESFTAPDGSRARWPGDFSAPGMVINCRCTTLPVVKEAA